MLPSMPCSRAPNKKWVRNSYTDRKRPSYLRLDKYEGVKPDRTLISRINERLTAQGNELGNLATRLGRVFGRSHESESPRPDCDIVCGVQGGHLGRDGVCRERGCRASLMPLTAHGVAVGK
jgi:hypothetical protein